jgi:cytoskeleton protein RodZ
MFEIGNSLQEARLRQGLELPELEQATKIRARYLRALEEEQFDQLPAPTYVKGFLRSYADYLGLDGQLYVDEYNSRYVVGEEAEPVVRPRRSSAGRAQRQVESRVIVFALVGIAVVTALVIAAWKSGGSNEPQAIPNLGSAAPRARAPKVQKPARPRKQVAAPKPKQAHLVLTAARGNCWLEVHVRTPDGKLGFVGTLEEGARPLSLTAKRLWIRAGAPQNLDVELNGKPRSFPDGPVTLVVTPSKIAKAPPAA